ncbi:MAG: hypothetical protein AAF583_02725 [Pseudomonadota bacterium]
MSDTTAKPKRQGKNKRAGTWTPSRLAMAASGLGATAATGYMNVTAWMAQAGDDTEKLINATISGSLELAGVAGIAFAGYQVHKKRPLRAALSGAFACAAVYFNVGASEQYYAALDAARENAIEASAAAVPTLNADIERLQAEVDSMVEQNGGKIPRTPEIIEAAYQHLDPEKNPINMGRKATELAVRAEYDRLHGEITDARDALSEASVEANDELEPIIDKDERLIFVWALEAFKGGVFFMIGTEKLSPPKTRNSSTQSPPHQPPGPQPANDARPRREKSPDEKKRAKGYAIARQKGWNGPS